MRMSSATYQITFYSFDFDPKTEISLTWVQLSNGNYEAVDRGQSADIYTTKLSIIGESTLIDSIQLQIERMFRLETNKYLTLDQFNGKDDQIFGANINYSGSLYATPTKIGKRKQRTKTTYSIDVELQLVPNYSYVGQSLQPSSYNLLSNHVGTFTSYDKYNFSNTLAYNFYGSDLNSGTFEGTFVMSATDTKNFRYAVFNSIRGATMTIWDTMGIGRLFGPTRANYPIGVKILEYSDRMISKDFWEIQLTLAEVK